MLPFSAILLRDYYRAIGWNEDNTYTQLTRSSSALLDFQIPSSLVLQLANSPSPVFFTSYSLDALPQLNGAISYITTSAPVNHIGPSRSIPFRHVVERFKVHPPPRRPLPKDEIWLRGRRIEGRDYLLYSRLHLPSLHLSGLATTRLTPTLQAHLAFLSQPNPPTPRTSQYSSHSRQLSEPPSPNVSSSTPGNVLFSLQHDTGRYSGEYTYSAQDGMFGLRGLYNFGWQDQIEGQDNMDEGAVDRDSDVLMRRKSQARRRAGVDEEEAMDGGLRGRFSAGGEVYFSAKQRSFGISTGLRFTTLPPHPPTPGLPPPSPPTTLTLLYNPLIGFMSSAYSAQVSPTVALSSRFGVNIYSYESDFSFGGEWWIGRRRGKQSLALEVAALDHNLTSGTEPSLRSSDDAPSIREGPSLRDRAEPIEAEVITESLPVIELKDTHRGRAEEERDGVLKGRISGNWSLALLYEARIRNCLVSIGVISDVLSRQRAIRSVGLEVQYFS